MIDTKIEKIVNKYEMTGAYVSGAKRVEYKHYDATAKQNMIRELNTEVQKKVDEASREGFVAGSQMNPFKRIYQLIHPGQWKGKIDYSIDAGATLGFSAPFDVGYCRICGRVWIENN